MGRNLFLISGLLFFAAVANAAGSTNEKIVAAMEGLLPDTEINDINESVLPGIFQVTVGAEIFYVSKDGNYLFRGDILDLNTRQNLTEEQRGQERRKILKDIPDSDYIEFAAKDAAKASVYVFTDVSCGYCRKLHQDVPKLNEAGLNVRYLAFPRRGKSSPTYDTMVSIWCAKDRNAAMTEAKAGNDIKTAICDNPVEKEFKLGQTMGVRGTPTIYLENGTAIPGYIQPYELLRRAQQN